MEKTIEKITQWLYEKVQGANARGFVVGLSGGIDSACTAALAQRAVGDEVLAVLMPCHSQPIDAEYAQLVVDTFNLKSVTVDLGSTFDAIVAALPPADKGKDDAVSLARANIKPRLRMTTLYYMASANNYLVAGTGNKSELLVGYFTKYGDGGVDLEPLGELYKYQVRELAWNLQVPQPIIDRPPTAGLWPGQTDEDEMGITYQMLDDTLAAIEIGETAVIDPYVLTRVEKMIAVSEHKRHAPPVCPI
ncbi:MAG: NAD(+) synthase [Anaerolineales bacterium]|nr:NAD(+) synthase [Anaerolineales bacterium]